MNLRARMDISLLARFLLLSNLCIAQALDVQRCTLNDVVADHERDVASQTRL